MHIRDEKEHLRQSIKERAARLRPQERLAESRSIGRRVTEQLGAGTQVITAFYPMPSEPDIRELLQELIDAGHAVYLPRFMKNGFEFRRCAALEDLRSGMFRLLEPAADAQPLDARAVNYALIPGIAFDRAGGRLGRGNGGFDRWIADVRAHNPGARMWGVALECQLVARVPMEPHDQRMDAIITAREPITC